MSTRKTHMALTCHCCLSHLPPPRYLKLRKERQPRPPPQHGCVPAGRAHGFYSQSLSSGTALLQFQQTCGTGYKNSELQAVWAPAHEPPQCGQAAWDEDWALYCHKSPFCESGLSGELTMHRTLVCLEKWNTREHYGMTASLSVWKFLEPRCVKQEVKCLIVHTAFIIVKT